MCVFETSFYIFFLCGIQSSLLDLALILLLVLSFVLFLLLFFFFLLVDDEDDVDDDDDDRLLAHAHYFYDNRWYRFLLLLKTRFFLNCRYNFDVYVTRNILLCFGSEQFEKGFNFFKE